MTTVLLPITSYTAMVCATLLLVATMRVVRLRRRDGVVLGDNGDRILTKAIRGQANASEQIPLGLIMIGLIEFQCGSIGVLWFFAAIFAIGRILHAVYFGIHGTPWQLRFYGMIMTMLAQGAFILLLLTTYL